MTTAIYVRLSQDVAGDRLAVRRQRADCEKLCKTRGWSPVAVYEDNDISAYTGRTRPAYDQMMEAVAEHVVRRIVAWHPDRLHRSVRELEDFIDIIEATGCAVVTVTEGHYDLSTVSGRMTARIIGTVARAESEHKSERIRRKNVELAEAGRWVGGGVRPFGYTKTVDQQGKATLAPDPFEAKEVKAMMVRFLAGESARAIAADLQQRGVPTVNGGTWRRNTVQGILVGAVISGQREHQGQIVAAGDWPAIVTPQQTAQARAIATFRQTSDGRDGTPRHLLTGLCVCGKCGGRMYAAHTSHGSTSMRCALPPNGCGNTAIRRGPLEQLIVEAVLQVVDQAELPTIHDPAGGDMARDLRDAEARLAELSAAYADNLISMGEWRIARDRIQQHITSHAHQAAAAGLHDAAIRPYAGKTGRLRKAWPGLDTAQQRGILAALIATITIGPAVKGRNRFDPNRVNIEWNDA